MSIRFQCDYCKKRHFNIFRSDINPEMAVACSIKYLTVQIEETKRKIEELARLRAIYGR